jgi:hypothetical protein
MMMTGGFFYKEGIELTQQLGSGAVAGRVELLNYY